MVMLYSGKRKMSDNVINSLFKKLKADGMKFQKIWDRLYLKGATVIQVNRLILQEFLGR